MRGIISIDFNKGSLDNFRARCDVAIRNVARGTKKATEAACMEIMTESMEQVPKDTLTLANSAFWEVSRRTDVSEKSYVYEATLGYGGNDDPINYKSGLHASNYMVAVHEDLSVYHPTGKAKFLEDPLRAFGEEGLERTVFKYARESLAGMQ